MCMRKVECAHVLVCVATPGDLWPHYARTCSTTAKEQEVFYKLSRVREIYIEREGDGEEGEERISQLNFELVKIGQRNE